MVTHHLWKYAKKHIPSIILGTIVAGCLGIVTGLPSLFIKSFVDELLVGGKIENLRSFFFLFLGLFTAKAFFMYASWIMHRVGTAISCMIRNDFFTALLDASIEELNEIPQSTLQTHFMTDMTQMQNGIILFFRQGVKSLVETIFLLGIAFYRNPLLTFIALTTMPFLLFFFKSKSKYLRTYSHKAQEALEALNSHFQEIFFGQIEVKMYNKEEEEKKTFSFKNQTYFAAARKSAHCEALIPALVEFFIFGALCLVLYIGLYQVQKTTITIGDLTSFFMALLLAYQPLRRSVAIIAEIQNGASAAERIFQIMQTCHKIKESDENKPITFNKKISLQNVSYNYLHKKTILNNISLTIHQGDRIALIGASGSGKSTFCNILLGLITPTHGAIFIDEQKLLPENKKSWRKKSAYISQNPFIFNSSIQENVCYENDKKERHESEILIALEKAGLLYNHKNEKIILHANGKELSGGEKQRLILARAFYANRSLLILDEATSALDAEKEAIIATTLDTLSPQTTIIVIAHKPLLIEKMTRIIKLEKGNLYELTQELPHQNFIANKSI